MLDFTRVQELISGLRLMRFMPSDDNAFIELSKYIAKFAETEEQVEWLVSRAQELYSEWPGVHELRALFCSRFKPKDGINAHSTIYIDGMPPSRPLPQPEILTALPPGHVVTADPQLDQAIQDLAKKKQLM